MANKWVTFVKDWSAKKGVSYACAISMPECREEYRKKYGNRKKLTQKKERELMGAEDVKPSVSKLQELIPFSQIIEKTKKEKKEKEEKGESKERESMGAEDVRSKNVELDKKLKNLQSKVMGELKDKSQRKQELIEMSRMMGEDRDAKPKVEPKVEPKAEPKEDFDPDLVGVRLQVTDINSFGKLSEKNKKKVEEALDKQKKLGTLCLILPSKKEGKYTRLWLIKVEADDKKLPVFDVDKDFDWLLDLHEQGKTKDYPMSYILESTAPKYRKWLKEKLLGYFELSREQEDDG